jgi:hypothetical protein
VFRTSVGKTTGKELGTFLFQGSTAMLRYSVERNIKGGRKALHGKQGKFTLWSSATLSAQTPWNEIFSLMLTSYSP